MLVIIGLFLLTQILYHFFVTCFWYWFGIIDQSNLALIRDWLWIAIVWCYCLYNIKYWKDYFKSYWKIIVAFLFLLFFWFLTSYFLFEKSFSDILIWVKYGVWWMIIILSATAVWFFMQKRKVNLHKAFPYVKWGLVSILVLWWIWQGLKLIVPDFFYSIGYWKLDDFHYWENPPIYYLTWYEWDLRWQWLFSWPNNYWYFLVAFLPFVWRFFTNKIKKKENTVLSVLALVVWMAWMVATLSRAALVWMVVVFVALYRSKLKSKKRRLIRWGIWLLVSLAVLSVLKRESTVGHITSKLSTIPEVISQPLGHGLGSSGPAVHYEWKYLPENYFLQIMLDIGTIWFLFRTFAILCLLLIQYNVNRLITWKLTNEEECQLQILYKLQIWFFALFIMWLFLHVFEDSMVNYLFFTIYGIVLWSLSTKLKGELSWKEVLEQNKDLH